jgi:hypothetical protein
VAGTGFLWVEVRGTFEEVSQVEALIALHEEEEEISKTVVCYSIYIHKQ